MRESELVWFGRIYAILEMIPHLGQGGSLGYQKEGTLGLVCVISEIDRSGASAKNNKIGVLDKAMRQSLMGPANCLPTARRSEAKGTKPLLSEPIACQGI